MNPYITNSLLPFIVSAGVATLVLVYFAPVAREIGLVDHPTERKRHEHGAHYSQGQSCVPAVTALSHLVSFR